MLDFRSFGIWCSLSSGIIILFCFLELLCFDGDQLCMIYCRVGACKQQLNSFLDEHGRSETDINPQLHPVICCGEGSPSKEYNQ